mmetsp:Transcript_9327/g.15992  ORF Transcript_9327/g.15992 Transcript_9327/m.15992 type:complete len:378 (-) Transcript_9327:140-1273(-)
MRDPAAKTCGQPSPCDLTCSEIILETPPGPASEKSSRTSGHCGLDNSSSSSYETGNFVCADRPNVGELWTCEQERMDGSLEERIVSLIERSERFRPTPSYSPNKERLGCKVASSLSSSCLMQSARRACVLEVVELCDRFELTTQTAAMAVNYLDRTLSTNLVKRRNYNGAILKAVTLACLSIATKLEEVVMLTPDDLQVYVPPFERIDTSLVNMVEQTVLIQLDWHLLVPTAVDLFTPFLCYLQAMPLWFNANECHAVVPTAWVDAHTTLWIKSCDYIHRTLADAVMMEFSAAELALGSLMCTLEECWEGGRTCTRLCQLFAHIETQFSKLDHAKARRCRDTLQRLVVVSEISSMPPSPTSTLRARPVLGTKRKAAD